MAGILSLFTRGRGAIFLSALVLPGSGQFFVQERHIAGLFYGFFCGLTALWFFVVAMWEIVVFYSGSMSDLSGEVPAHPGWQHVALSFAAAMFCWFMNVLDTWFANRQITKREKEVRLAELKHSALTAEHSTSTTERRTPNTEHAIRNTERQAGTDKTAGKP